MILFTLTKTIYSLHQSFRISRGKPNCFYSFNSLLCRHPCSTKSNERCSSPWSCPNHGMEAYTSEPLTAEEAKAGGIGWRRENRGGWTTEGDGREWRVKRMWSGRKETAVEGRNFGQVDEPRSPVTQLMWVGLYVIVIY